MKKQNRFRLCGKSALLFFFALLTVIAAILLSYRLSSEIPVWGHKDPKEITWVDFSVPYELLEQTMELDIESYGSETHLNWIELLACLGAKYGGNFSLYKSSDLDALVEKLRSGEIAAHLMKGTNYDYYLEAYTAVLGGFLGEYQQQVIRDNGENKQELVWEKTYGLKAYSPIAAGYWYSDYDDFGAGRSYGYKRKHFGHDLMVSVGTPIIAVESGIVETLGWNQYGGWRIGIRSLDSKRYYYYAHLRKGTPYASGLYEGKAVSAGDLIGYSGQTGYSTKENVNNIRQPHLHFGIQLIFDEAKKDDPNEIWVDLYAITRLLSKHRSRLCYDESTKQLVRALKIKEPSNYSQTKETASGIASPKASSADEENTAAVPILMYHGLIKDPALQNRFMIDPALLESDLKYLKSQGYTAVVMSDLIAYVKDGKALPEKPIVLTFDDGFYNNYYYAWPLLQKYGMKGVISVVGALTDNTSQMGSEKDNPNYSYLTWLEIGEMQESGVIEIQNHSYNSHTNTKQRKGVKRNSGESKEDYRAYLKKDLGFMQERTELMTGKIPTTFTFPYGALNEDSTVYLKELGFQASLSCTEGINYLTGNSSDEDALFNLKRILRPPGQSSEDFFKENGIM